MTPRVEEFALPQGMSLPILGEEHPLRRRWRRTFVLSATFAMLAHVIIAGGRIAVSRYLASREDSVPTTMVQVDLENIVPPSIQDEEPPEQVGLAEAVSAPAFAIPEPVADYEAEELTMASEEEIASQFEGSDLSSLTGAGDSLVVDASGYGDPSEYEVVEEMPVLIHMPPPEYPAIARTAEVEGVVVLRLLVGTDGGVEKVVVVEGPDMLRDAAKEAAMKAKFKPALEQQRPVRVWVLVPLSFSLT